MKRINNQDVAQLLSNIADILQILDENIFRINAYRNAAEAVANLGQDINTIFAEGNLEKIPGVGKGLAAALKELLSTGHVADFAALQGKVPAGVVAMMQVPDMGPKKARRLWEELGIVSVEALKAAAEAGRLRALKGFGEKSEQKILKGIELLARRESRIPIGVARPLALALVEGLRQAVSADAVQRLALAGSLRRWKETIGDLDLLCVSYQPALIMSAFQSLPQVSEVTHAGETKSSVILHNGLQADIRVVKENHWGAALQYFTGNKEHNIEVREIALKQGWSLNEYGLSAMQGDEQRFFTEEEALYEFLGLAWTPPELRENRGEIQAARQHALPPLIELAAIRGELHGHTTWSDGTATIAEMADAAYRRGYQYWNVADHSAGLGMVGGLDSERIQRQASEIAAINQRYADAGLNFRLLRGSEVEILADGALGLPDETLAELDVVVASIHSQQRQDRETITERCLRAIRNPHVDILGHPTGRLLGHRPPSDLDVERVLQACAATGTTVEINAAPERLDINDIYARRAVELGCKIAINSDAHAPTGMDKMEYGLAVARRAWLKSGDVVNTLPYQELMKSLKS
jgi:DNA polymerase (family 10)